MKTSGEVGVVTLTKKHHPKMQNKEKTCFFIGYDEDHAGDCYKMYHPETNKIYKSRDVVFLKRMYFSFPNLVHEISIEPLSGVI